MIDFMREPEKWIWGPVFKPQEFSCKSDGQCLMDPDFMDLLFRLRVMYSKPLVVSSGYRSPEYNAKVSATGDTGPHTTGRAVDFFVGGNDAYELLRVAVQLKFTGIGFSQKGPSRFIHLDNLTAPTYPRPMIWSY